MNLSGLILKTIRWRVEITVPDYDKCIICVAPHTSNLDFILGKLAYASSGRKAGFLMKESWFFWPLGAFLRAIGGIAVPRRRKGSSLVNALIDKFRSSGRLTIAITPEGTRSRTSQWRTGFLQIAYQTKVKVVLGVIDYPSRTITIKDTFTPTGDADTDMRSIKDYYKPFNGRYPDKFSTD